MENSVVKKQYNLFTAISMIVGIVIGSGIFFKSDDILAFTGGNVWLGILVFIIAAISIIFGSLSIAQLAVRTDKAGGVITYMEESWSKPLSGAYGFYHAFVYYPTIIVIVSWVSGIYINQLFGFEQTLVYQCLIGFSVTVILFAVNIYAKKIGDYLQISSTVIKLVPLLLIAFAGLFIGEPSNVTAHAVISNVKPFGFIAAIVPIAFSFDGWIMSTSISHEIKDSKKSLPLALIFSPIFIVALYSLYLAGISALVGPEQILALGDAHVDVAANMLLGATGAKILLTFVVVSVVGCVNGVVIASMRLPYSLAKRDMFPNSQAVSKVDEKLDVPMISAFISLVTCVVWYVIHYFVMKYDLLFGSDVSELAIVINYVCYIALYIGVIKLFKSGEITSKIKGVVIPCCATLGSLIIFFGSAINSNIDQGFLNIKNLSFMGISVVIMAIAFAYCKKKSK